MGAQRSRRRANAARMARSVQSGLGPGDPTTEHRGFVPENHDLRVLVRLTAAEQRQPADPDHDQVERAEGHELRSCRNQLVGANSGSQHERRVLYRYRQSFAVVSPSVIQPAIHCSCAWVQDEPDRQTRPWRSSIAVSGCWAAYGHPAALPGPGPGPAPVPPPPTAPRPASAPRPGATGPDDSHRLYRSLPGPRRGAGSATARPRHSTPHRGQQPVQLKPARPGLITSPQRRRVAPAG